METLLLLRHFVICAVCFRMSQKIKVFHPFPMLYHVSEKSTNLQDSFKSKDLNKHIEKALMIINELQDRVKNK